MTGLSFPIIQTSEPQNKNSDIKMARRDILTLKEKKEICQYKDGNPSCTLTKLIAYAFQQYGKRTTMSTLRRVLSKKASYLSLENATDTHKRIRTAKFPDLEQAMNTWCDQVTSQPLEAGPKLSLSVRSLVCISSPVQ